MKKTFATEAINLKNYPLNDNDSIVVMFSKTKGLLRAVAKGSKRPKSKLGARIQMFIANKILLSEGKNLDTISEIESVKTFSKIRGNLDKLTYSMYIAELVNNFCSINCDSKETHEEIYNLIFKTFNLISDAKNKESILLYLIKFMIKFTDILGWGLDFKYCSICQRELDLDKEKSSRFSFQQGGFLCLECSNTLNSINIHNKIVIFLNELLNCKIDEKTKYDELVNEIILEKCFNFLKKYIDNLTNKKTKIFEVLEKIKV